MQQVRNNLTELQKHKGKASCSSVTVTGTGLAPDIGGFGGNRRAGPYSLPGRSRGRVGRKTWLRICQERYL